MSEIISSNKKIAKNSIYLYTRMILLTLISLYTVRICIKTLGVENYGIYSAVAGVVLAFSFLSQSLVNASQRFFAVEIGHGDKNSLNKVFNCINFTYIVLSVILFIIFETIGVWFLQNKMIISPERLEAATVLFHISVINFIVTLLTNPYNALVIANEQMNIFAGISIFEGVIRLLIVFLLVFIPVDKLVLYGYLLLGTSLINFAIYYFICKKKYGYIHLNFKIDRITFKNVFSYSSWTLIGTLANVANRQGINVLLNIFFGPLVNAAYSIGNQVSGLLSRLTGDFSSAIQAPLTKSYSTNNINKCIDLFYLGNIVILYLLYIALIPLYFEIETLLRIWLGEVEPNMVPFCRLMLINVAIISISNPITTIVQAAGKVKLYHGTVDTIVLITLPLSYIALKKSNPPEFVFYISNLVFILVHILRLSILRTIIDFNIKRYVFKFVIPALFILLMDMFLLEFIVNTCVSNFLRVILSFMISFITLSFLWFIIMLSKSQRISIKNLIMLKIKRK